MIPSDGCGRLAQLQRNDAKIHAVSVVLQVAHLITYSLIAWARRPGRQSDTGNNALCSRTGQLFGTSNPNRSMSEHNYSLEGRPFATLAVATRKSCGWLAGACPRAGLRPGPWAGHDGEGIDPGTPAAIVPPQAHSALARDVRWPGQAGSAPTWGTAAWPGLRCGRAWRAAREASGPRGLPEAAAGWSWDGHLVVSGERVSSACQPIREPACLVDGT